MSLFTVQIVFVFDEIGLIPLDFQIQKRIVSAETICGITVHETFHRINHITFDCKLTNAVQGLRRLNILQDIYPI